MADNECEKSLDGRHDLVDTGEYRRGQGEFKEKKIRCTHCDKSLWVTSTQRNTPSRLEVG